MTAKEGSERDLATTKRARVGRKSRERERKVLASVDKPLRHREESGEESKESETRSLASPFPPLHLTMARRVGNYPDPCILKRGPFSDRSLS